MENIDERFKSSGGKKHCDTYFQTVCSENKKIIPVDISNNAIFDHHVNNNKADILTRKSMKLYPNEKYTIFSPSIPFDLPNKYKSIMPNELFKENHTMTGIHHVFKGYKNYTMLKKKHHKLFHESLTSLEGCDKLFDDFLCRSLNHSQHFHVNNLGMISDFISDIPKELLIQLLDESLLSQCEDLEENYNLRNCLAHYQNNGRIVIFCPTGEYMDYVAVKEILIDSDEIISHPIGFKMLKSIDILKVHVDYLIKEVIVSGEKILHIRGDYQCNVYHIDLLTNSCNLILLRKLNFNKMVHAIGVNFNFSNEMFVVAEDRSISQFFDVPQQNKTIDNAFSKPVKWQSCVYGNSRETCLVSNEDDIIMYDFRMKNSTPNTYFNISCEYLNNKTEKLSPVLLWNPMNQHQYFVSTNQAILINDERYLKTPVMQFNHYLKSLPYFVQTHSDILQADEHMLLVFGSYKSAESVLYQLFANGTKEVSFGNSEKLKCNNPVTVTQPLYKFSDYSDWKSYLNDWRLSLSFDNRLSQPCIGMNLIPLTSLTGKTNKHITFMQQSFCGDLFFQQISKPDIDISGNRSMSGNTFGGETVFKNVLLTEHTDNITLMDTCKRRCKTWMDNIVENIKIYDNSVENNSVIVEANIVENIAENSIAEINIESTCNKQSDDEMIGYYEEIDKFATCVRDEFEYNNPEDKLTVDIDNVCDQFNDARKSNICQLKHIESTENTENHVDCSCYKCSVEWYKKISRCKDERKILTRKLLGLSDVDDLPVKYVALVNDLKHENKPLNQLFTTQWNEEEYKPLDVFAPNVAFVSEDD